MGLRWVPVAAMRQMRRVGREMPTLVGAFVSYIAILGLLLVVSPWVDALAGTPGLSTLGTGARLGYGLIFLALTAVALWRPVRGGGTAIAFLAGWLAVKAIIARPVNLVGLIFWCCILAWTCVALWRFLVGRVRGGLPR